MTPAADPQAAPSAARPGGGIAAAGWAATLDLGFERQGGRTVLAHCRHEGPLRVQKALHPEGPDLAHAIVLHPPGGVAGGDTLSIGTTVGDHARALITTPGAGKWYRSGGRPAAQSTWHRIGAGASLEWLPQETIVFAGADAALATRIDLAADACFLGLETLCLGRTAAGERFDGGRLSMHTQIRRDGRLLWHEGGRLVGGGGWLDAAPGLAGRPVCATLLVAVPGAIEAALLAACRALPVRDAALGGITVLPGLLVGRMLAGCGEAVREWFLEIWRLLRPSLFGREAVMPRIWTT